MIAGRNIKQHKHFEKQFGSFLKSSTYIAQCTSRLGLFAIIKCHWLDGLETKFYFLTILKAGGPRARCGSSWSLSPWLADGCLLTVPHMAVPSCTWIPGSPFLSKFHLLTRTQSDWVRTHLQWSCFRLIPFVKSLSPNTVTFWGTRG